MIRANLAIRSTIGPDQGQRSDCFQNAQPGRIESCSQFRPKQNLIEHIPVVVHVLTGVVEVRSRGVADGISEVAPHWIVEERVFTPVDLSCSTGRNLT